MSGAVCVYQCRDCGRVATGPANKGEPEGWGYDDDEAQYVCPDHAAGFRDEDFCEDCGGRFILGSHTCFGSK